MSSKGQRAAQPKPISPNLGTSNVFSQANKVTNSSASILVPGVVMQDDIVKKMFKDKEGAQNRGR